MPPEMAVDMRHTKLKAEEAALLAGELTKPSWQSRNEGIHERVSFEDAIWGFDLAGGAYYNTPLRVVGVKPDSRAEKAGIRPGDRLKRINDIDTSTLTIQEAHEIIIASGIHLKIAVTAPEDEEDAYYCYEDPIVDDTEDEEALWKKKEEERQRQIQARVSSYWSLQWPWVSKRRIIYRESNCFMVPSKFEEKHRSKFSPQPYLRVQDDIVLDSIQSKNDLKYKDDKQQNTIITNGLEPANKNIMVNGGLNLNKNAIANGEAIQLNGDLDGIPEIAEIEETLNEEVMSLQEDISEDTFQLDESKDDLSRNEVWADESHVEGSVSVEESQNSQLEERVESKAEESVEETPVDDSEDHDEVINEVLEDESFKMDDENIIDSILSGGEDQEISHSDER